MRRSALLFAAGAISAIALPALAQQGMLRFHDVAETDFYAQDLEVLVDQGILKGYEDGRFGPNEAVTRGQIAAILRRYDSANVQPIRDQLREIRARFDLGACGDGEIQIGEDCDDGNTRNNDGCSEYCMEQLITSCSDGHHVGESYPSADGCNSCSCTGNGEICTLRYCAPDPAPDCSPYVCADGTNVDRCTDDGHIINYFAEPCLTHGGEAERTKCYGDNQCSGGEVCSTRYGDCESACEPGAEVCMQVCAGYCIQPRDRGPTSCEDLRKDFNELAETSVACRMDADCMIFESSCPFVTCGVAVSTASRERIASAADAYTSCLEDSGKPIACAGCVAMKATCENNVCVSDSR